MDELTAAREEELRLDLLALREELRRVVLGPGEVARPVSPDSAIGRLSRLDAIQVQQMARANVRMANVRLQQVGAALQRVARGTFGECADCGDDIGYPRLKARPEAPFCLSCQGRREST